MAMAAKVDDFRYSQIKYQGIRIIVLKSHCRLLTLEIWGSSEPVSQGDHLHQTVPKVQRQQGEGILV